MGWRPTEGYYQKHVKKEGFSNKITLEQEGMNKLSPDEIREGIQIVQHELARESRDIGKVNLKDGILDVPYMLDLDKPYVKYEKDKEREYVVEDKVISINKKDNVSNIKVNTDGEER